jgi:hypothetical protein
VTDPYFGREQTKAKHFILRRYLQALAFKVLRFKDILAPVGSNASDAGRALNRRVELVAP